MRPGQIMLWYGSLTSIPGGWYICDGTMNTPDLRNCFVVGAGDTFNPDDEGGANAHGHNYNGPLHTHTVDAGPTVLASANFHGTTDQSRMSGETDWNSHRPPYKALCYMMKIN